MASSLGIGPAATRGDRCSPLDLDRPPLHAIENRSSAGRGFYCPAFPNSPAGLGSLLSEPLNALPDLTNNPMHECFTMFLRETGFAPPMSRRRVTNRRESLLPPLIPDRHQRAIVFDPSAAPGPAVAINGKAEEPPGGRTRHSTHYWAAKQASQTIDVAIPELITGNHLLARLVFQRIRSHNHSRVIGEQSCSPDEPQHARPPIRLPEMASTVIGCAAVPASAPIPPMETLFTQLARRRLRGRATEETR
jgi:hypothetical protein